MIEKDELYPLLFQPIYVNVVWGGTMLSSYLGRELPQTEVPVGESWEISDRDGAESIVSNGELKGLAIGKLIEYYGKSLLGENFRGGRFPLLVKLIDAGKRLSLQVHPDEANCRANPGAEPKTEMWYIMGSKPGAKIYAGLRPNCTRMQFVENIKSTDIENCLQIYRSEEGDAYYIPAGRVHAIGSGNLLLEIQQNSNTTFRISDWGRVGSDGKSRELHIDQAFKCINFMDRVTPRISGVSDLSAHNRKYPIINRCPFFKVDEMRLVESYLDRTARSSFQLLTAVNNPVTISSREKKCEIRIEKGRTALVPANFGGYTIEIDPGHNATVIKTSI